MGAGSAVSASPPGKQRRAAGQQERGCIRRVAGLAGLAARLLLQIPFGKTPWNVQEPGMISTCVCPISRRRSWGESGRGCLPTPPPLRPSDETFAGGRFLSIRLSHPDGLATPGRAGFRTDCRRQPSVILPSLIPPTLIPITITITHHGSTAVNHRSASAIRFHPLY